MRILIAILSLAALSISCGTTSRVNTAGVEEAFEAKHFPLGFRKVNLKETEVIRGDFNGYGKDGRGTFFKLPDGDPNGREDQPSLVFINSNATGYKVQGGGGTDFHGICRVRKAIHKGPSERNVGLMRGSKLYADDMLLMGIPSGKYETVHQFTLNDDSKLFAGRLGPVTVVHGQSAIRASDTHHGVKGPNDNVTTVRNETYAEWASWNRTVGIPKVHKGDSPKHRFKEVQR